MKFLYTCSSIDHDHFYLNNSDVSDVIVHVRHRSAEQNWY